jgi:hypothetical protein
MAVKVAAWAPKRPREQKMLTSRVVFMIDEQLLELLCNICLWSKWNGRISLSDRNLLFQGDVEPGLGLGE